MARRQATFNHYAYGGDQCKARMPQIVFRLDNRGRLWQSNGL